MKKTISLLLVLVLCLSLCACGKSKAVKSVEAQIEELTNVTYEDKDKVAAVRQAYNDLEAKDRKAVENLSVLIAAENKIAEEKEKLIDDIASGSDPYKAIEELRQMGNSKYVQTKITEVGVKMLRDYVLNEGYTSDYRGKSDPSEDNKAVEVCGYYLVVNPDFEAVWLKYSIDKPVNRWLRSEYEIDHRDCDLLIGYGGGDYSETEWIYEGWKYVGYANWDCITDTNNLSKMPVYSVDFSDVLVWPYIEFEEYLVDNCYLNMESALQKLDDCLRALEMPVTARELCGIYS